MSKKKTNTQETDQASAETVQTPAFKASRQFGSWLIEQQCSLAFTTYQAGKLFFIGTQRDGRLSIHERTFNRCMGLFATGNSLYLSSIYQLWKFENALLPGQLHQDQYDRLYIPQIAYTTGDLDVHDINVNADGAPIFVNTLFSCIATTSDTHSFAPVWRPPFVSKLAAEDRCHLNGMALEDGEVRYVTAVSQSDIHEGWREKRENGGIIMDVESGEVVCDGLSMPHSPRLYNGKLWLHNSGTGEFGFVDLDKGGTFEAIAFCPGYLRGLAFTKNFAVVTLSKTRKNEAFSDLQLSRTLEEKNTQAQCGLYVINLDNGDIVHSLMIEGLIEELYDVAILPQVRCPMALGTKSDEIRRMIMVADDPA